MSTPQWFANFEREEAKRQDRIDQIRGDMERRDAMTDEATPRPWFVDPEYSGSSAGIAIYARDNPLRLRPATAYSLPDAALIVRAVNERDELIAALRKALDYIDGVLVGVAIFRGTATPRPTPERQALLDILAKAEAP